MTETLPLSIGLCVQAACIFDVAADKPGNVSFRFPRPDMDCVDFLLSAAAIAPVMDQAPFRSVGQTILQSIQATRRVTSTNTNLGIVLLLAPLACVPPYSELKDGVVRALNRLTVDDAKAAYEAIRLAQPGGLGVMDHEDVAGEPTVTLHEAMALAAERDTVARQYGNEFEQVFEGAKLLRDELRRAKTGLKFAVTNVYLRLLAEYPDSLIARKHGIAKAKFVSDYAAHVLQSGDEKKQISALRMLTNGPNPGTTADIVTASLFVALRTGMIALPLNSRFHSEA